MGFFHGIRARFLTFAVGGLFFVSVVSALATHMITRAWLETRTIERIETELVYIGDYLVEPILNDDRIAIEEVIRRTVQGRPDIEYLFVVSADGRVIGSSFIGGVPEDVLAANPLPDSGGDRVRRLHSDKESVLDVVHGILEGRAGQVRVGVRESVISDLVERSAWTLQVTQAGFLALAVLASIALADVIVRPIRALLVEMRKVTSGDLSGQVEILGGDEIAELGGAFNVMVAEMRRSRDELRDMAVRAQGIVSSFPSALFVIDLDATIQSVNPAARALTGRPESALTGTKLSDLFVIGPDHAPVGGLESLLRPDGVTLSYDMALRQLGGETSPVAFQSAPMTGPGGSLKGYVVEVRDLARLSLAIAGLEKQRAHLEERFTDLFDRLRNRAAEDEQVNTHLVRSDRLVSLGQMAASVAHEINNPLFGITTFARVIEREVKKGNASEIDLDRARHAAERIVAESARCASIVHAFLGYARPAPPTIEEVSLARPIEAVRDLIAANARDQGVEIALELGSPDTVLADPDQLHQVFLNVEINALQAMPDGGRLSVRTVPRAEENRIHVVISDTGCGIPKDVLPKVFDPFFTTKPAGVGTGLGLAIAKVLVTRHGGSIAIASAPGEGTEVTITLPLSTERNGGGGGGGGGG